jgi:LysM repeat protein
LWTGSFFIKFVFKFIGMRKCFLLSLFLLWHHAADAQTQKKDSFFVVVKEDRFFVRHLVKKNETVMGVAVNYKVPAIVFSQNNEMALQETPKPGKPVLIPLGNYNFFKKEPANPEKARPLYYRVKQGDRLSDVSRYGSVNENLLRDWNRIDDDSKLQAVLMVGWVSYTPPGSQNETTMDMGEESSKPVGMLPTGGQPLQGAAGSTTDTAEAPSRLEQMYDYQTSNGTMVIDLAGTVVFYTAQTTVSSGMLYGFSNDVPKGKVVKITNTSNGKFAFVRILGPLPATKQYYNAKLGVDSRAKTELGIRDNKLWCAFSYGGG